MFSAKGDSGSPIFDSLGHWLASSTLESWEAAWTVPMSHMLHLHGGSLVTSRQSIPMPTSTASLGNGKNNLIGLLLSHPHTPFPSPTCSCFPTPSCLLYCCLTLTISMHYQSLSQLMCFSPPLSESLNSHPFCLFKSYKPPCAITTWCQIDIIVDVVHQEHERQLFFNFLLISTYSSSLKLIALTFSRMKIDIWHEW